MGPNCESIAGKKSNERKCIEMNETQRCAVFKAFWENLATWKEKNVCSKFSFQNGNKQKEP